MATVTQNDAPSVGLDVAFSRSIAGQRPDYKWMGTTDKDGQVEIEIVADSGQFSRIGTTGYYLIRAIDPLSGEIAGQWGSLPINGGYEVLLSLPIGGTARLNAVSPLSGVSEPRASETPIGDTASLIDHLRAFGATAEPSGEISQPFFSVAGQIITVNGDGVQVFEYANAEAADVEAAGVSPDGSSIGTTIVSWIATPHFYKKDRLIVLYVGDSTVVINALEAVLESQFAGR